LPLLRGGARIGGVHGGTATAWQKGKKKKLLGKKGGD